MKSVYDVELSQSALSHSINRGTLSLQQALQFLAVCGAFGSDGESLRASVDGFVLGFEDLARILPGKEFIAITEP